ncbi:hypothetical protein SCP_0903150 [Sparassis crispa]|uniref:RRM Nup35-type domain-containing protein n=1 Tax=Sparassis crispa TaxID=139825 RepID=A0A401GW35_9APHY|nr:hypothetical protein SCP_0903150 [Sparassis crispa]GBE86436.1 hypothetical protein SCP_0903150 [Sparassis crispa]
MYSSTSYPSSSTSGPSQESRTFSYAHPHPANPTFTVAGMPPQAAGSPRVRGNTLGGSTYGMGFGGSLGMGPPYVDGLSHPKHQYQTGYLISVQPSGQQGNQRSDEVPLIQTKAKMNQMFAGSSASDFGMDSMFETSRQRQRHVLAGEDAPPTASLNDMMNEVYTDSGPSRVRSSTFNASTSRTSAFRSSQSTTPKPGPIPTSQSPPLYIIVFGYPPDKYSVTAEYFRSLGETTPPEPSTELSNCFRIGFVHPVEAMRAVRKNGEVLGGSWMVGAKWADLNQAEAVLGPAVVRGLYSQSEEESQEGALPSTSPPGDAIFPPGSGADVPETVGTPLRLAPSMAAFRKPATGAHATPQKTGAGLPGVVNLNAMQGSATVQQSPSKGMLEQVSDLIFGW